MECEWVSRIGKQVNTKTTHTPGTYVVFEFLRSQGVHKPHVYDGSWVEQLNAAGFAVAAIDHQSHGASEGIKGLRCYFQHFDDLALDVAVFAREMQRCTKQYTDSPLFIMGESMGGGLSTHIVLENPDMFQGCILLAPMLSLEKVSSKGINPYLRYNEGVDDADVDLCINRSASHIQSTCQYAPFSLHILVILFIVIITPYPHTPHTPTPTDPLQHC